ncbi:SDR family oxidoreductase [Candidatus Pelagibacter ubique]|nr:SDR family oxidoreductase [Candidatus Pelagibacter ubique]
MKILIIGGAGYVGGAVTDLLKKNTENELIVYDILLYESLFQKDVEFINGDIRNQALLKKYLKWADTVVWMAALVGDGACSINPLITKEINCDAVKYLADNFDGKIVFFSTCSVYGAQDDILNETSPTDPLSVYASTKLEAEKILSDKNALIFRLGTLFGIGDSYSRIRMDLVVNVLTAKAINDKKLTVFGGRQFRPLLHVKDAARVIEESVRSVNTGIYNLHLENTKIIDLAEKIKNLFSDVVIEKVDMKFQDSRNYQADGSKLRADFSFRPKFTVEDGVNEIKKLILEKRITDINDPRYTNQKYLEIFKSKLEYEEN